ncbi:hypothetical protein E2320_003314 [Naja naja]|nr:hypothetical protein E2320_003314 [Naja naja]
MEEEPLGGTEEREESRDKAPEGRLEKQDLEATLSLEQRALMLKSLEREGRPRGVLNAGEIEQAELDVPDSYSRAEDCQNQATVEDQRWRSQGVTAVPSG